MSVFFVNLRKLIERHQFQLTHQCIPFNWSHDVMCALFTPCGVQRRLVPSPEALPVLQHPVCCISPLDCTSELTSQKP